MQPYEAVIFDSDGVLVEPTDQGLYSTALREAFEDHGIADPHEGHLDALRSVTRDDLDRICGAYDLDPEAFWRSRDRCASAVQRTAIADGRKPAYDDLDAVFTINRPCAIVSNNQQRTIETVVETHGLGEVMTSYYGRQPTIEDIQRKKPHPHYVERALSDVGTRNALFVGDSNADLLAAERTGIDVAFVERPHRTNYQLVSEPDHTVTGLDGVAELVG